MHITIINLETKITYLKSTGLYLSGNKMKPIVRKKGMES